MFSPLPIPVPDGPYTLHQLRHFLEALSVHSFTPGHPGGPHDFRRSQQSAYRLVMLYKRLTGTEFEMTPGRKGDMLLFTREQFELFATVIYRSVLDATSYEFNFRRELNLPETGWGLLSGDGHGRNGERASGQSGGEQRTELGSVPAEVLAEIQALRDEVAQLRQERQERSVAGQLSEPQQVGAGAGAGADSVAQSGEVERLREQVGQLREALAEQQQVMVALRERLDSVQSGPVQSGPVTAGVPDEDVPTKEELMAPRSEAKGWNAQLRSDFRKDLRVATDASDAKRGVRVLLELVRDMYDRTDGADFVAAYAEALEAVKEETAQEE